MSTIGSRIRHMRQEAGLSVDDLAALLGKNRATVYRYESDEIENFPIAVIGPLAEALHTTPAYLMGWESVGESTWTKKFRQRLSDELSIINPEDAHDAAINVEHLENIASSRCPISLPEACEIADELGLSLDDMVGLNEESNTSAKDNLDVEIINLLLSLSENKKHEALRYMQYLAAQGDS